MKALRKIEKAAAMAERAAIKAVSRGLVTAYAKDVRADTGIKSNAVKQRIKVSMRGSFKRVIIMRLAGKGFAPFAGIPARGKLTGKYRLSVSTKPKRIKPRRGFMIVKRGRKMGFVRTGPKRYVFVRYKSLPGDYKRHRDKRRQTIKRAVMGRFRAVYKERFAYYSKR